MTYQVPPYRFTDPHASIASPAASDQAQQRRPFVPVQLHQPTNRSKRRHWAVRAVRVVCKAMFLCFCVFVGFVTFCVAFHHLTQWR